MPAPPPLALQLKADCRTKGNIVANVSHKRALVTGGAGFIGSHVVQHLVEDGWHVRVLDNLSTGTESNLSEVADCVELLRGDIRDQNDVRRACESVDVVFHLAAYISVPGSVAEPETADDVNIRGTLNMLLCAREAKVRRVVFSSSAAVYGEPATLPVPEDAPTRPASPYGLEKLYGEHMCRLFTELYGLETVALRYFNVYGPRQNPDSEYAAVIPKFISLLQRGERATIYGDGLQTRDFLYVSDVARANLLAAGADDVQGKTLNVASGIGVSIRELHTAIANLFGRQITPRYAPPRPGDVRHSVASIRQAQNLLGFRPAISLMAGLRSTADWLSSRSGC